MPQKTVSFADSFAKHISDQTVSLLLRAKKIPHLTLEGRVSCESGKLLIIDPCYLEGFDLREYESYDKEYERKEFEILKAQCEASPETRSPKDLPKNPSESDLKEYLESSKSWLKEMTASLKTRKELDKRRAELHETSFLRPPYVVQTQNYILFRNGIGDGHYPVIQRPRSHHLIFNYPINSRGYTDKTKLDGKLVGHSCVDSASQMIIDPIKSGALKKIGSNVNKQAYCILGVEKGDYSFNFFGKSKDGYEGLSIKLHGPLEK